MFSASQFIANHHFFQPPPNTSP